MRNKFPHLVWLIGEPWVTKHIEGPADTFAERHAGSELDYQDFIASTEPGQELRNMWAFLKAFPDAARLDDAEARLTRWDADVGILRAKFGDQRIARMFRNGLQTNDRFHEMMAEIYLHASLALAGLHREVEVPNSRKPGKNHDARVLILGRDVNMEFKFRSVRDFRIDDRVEVDVRLGVAGNFGYDVVLRRIPGAADGDVAVLLSKVIQKVGELALSGAPCQSITVEGQTLTWYDGMATADALANQLVESVEICLHDPEEKTVRHRGYSRAMVDPMLHPPQGAAVPDERTPVSRTIRQTVELARDQLPLVGINVVVVSSGDTKGTMLGKYIEDAIYGDSLVTYPKTLPVQSSSATIKPLVNGLFSTAAYADLSAVAWVNGAPLPTEVRIFPNPFATAPLQQAEIDLLQQVLKR